MPRDIADKAYSNSWENLRIEKGLREGKGIFAEKDIEKGEAVCNYGGNCVSNTYAEKMLIPFISRCVYLVELFENYKNQWQLFYINHDENSKESYGKYLNHSEIHPNLTPKVMVTEHDTLDIVFFSNRTIQKNEQLVWDYGPDYEGLNPCVDGCLECLECF